MTFSDFQHASIWRKLSQVWMIRGMRSQGPSFLIKVFAILIGQFGVGAGVFLGEGRDFLRKNGMPLSGRFVVRPVLCA